MKSKRGTFTATSYNLHNYAIWHQTKTTGVRIADIEGIEVKFTKQMECIPAYELVEFAEFILTIILSKDFTVGINYAPSNTPLADKEVIKKMRDQLAFYEIMFNQLHTEQEIQAADLLETDIIPVGKETSVKFSNKEIEVGLEKIANIMKAATMQHIDLRPEIAHFIAVEKPLSEYEKERVITSPCIIIKEGTSGSCPKCGSTERYQYELPFGIQWGFKIGCIQPLCENYYKRKTVKQ